MVWGARAIQERGSFSLLPDRQGWLEEEGAGLTRKQMVEALNLWVLPELRSLRYDGTKEDVASGEVDTPFGRFGYEASTHASYGYVYMAVWCIEPPAVGQRSVVFRGRKEIAGNPWWLDFIWGVNARAAAQEQPQVFDKPSSLGGGVEVYPEAKVYHVEDGDGLPTVVITALTERVARLFEGAAADRKAEVV